MSDIDALSAWSYERGEAPLTVAVDRVSTLLDVWINLAAGPAGTGLPAAWPDVSTQTAANKVVGMLLDAGWTPPSEDAVAAAVAQVKADEELHARRMASLTEVQRAELVQHCLDHGEMPSWWPPEVPS